MKVFIVKIDNGSSTACHVFNNEAAANEFHDKMSRHYDAVDPETWVLAPEECEVHDGVATALVNELDGEELRYEPEYCDNCGVQVFATSRYSVPILPVNIASANAGESAVLCPECWQTHICKWRKK
jgi:hypothetical protein